MVKLLLHRSCTGRKKKLAINRSSFSEQTEAKDPSVASDQAHNCVIDVFVCCEMAPADENYSVTEEP